MDNLQQQLDEIEALSSIYSDEWKCENESKTSFTMQINNDVKLYIYLDENYPSESPPTYLLQAPYLTKEEKFKIDSDFSEIYLENVGSPILFQWIEKLKEFTTGTSRIQENSETRQDNISHITDDVSSQKESNFVIHHGDTIVDRKSIFQGHACIVNSQQDIKCVMEELLTNKKIAQATHNILAYRIVQNNGVILQDCDDDGESHAGARLLHLLQMLDVKNVMVVVTRWYGGVHLGPDRFRHINNAARNVLEKASFI